MSGRVWKGFLSAGALRRLAPAGAVIRRKGLDGLIDTAREDLSGDYTVSDYRIRAGGERSLEYDSNHDATRDYGREF